MQPANVDLRDPNPDVPDNNWHKTYRDITARYVEGEGSIRRGFGIAPTIALLLDSAFPALETIAVIERRPMTTDQFGHECSATCRKLKATSAPQISQLIYHKMYYFSNLRLKFDQ